MRESGHFETQNSKNPTGLSHFRYIFQNPSDKALKVCQHIQKASQGQGIFKDCQGMGSVQLRNLYENCVFDITTIGDQFACSLLTSFAHMCTTKKACKDAMMMEEEKGHFRAIQTIFTIFQVHFMAIFGAILGPSTILEPSTQRTFSKKDRKMARQNWLRRLSDVPPKLDLQ